MKSSSRFATITMTATLAVATAAAGLALADDGGADRDRDDHGDRGDHPRCRKIRGHLVEDVNTTACTPPATRCFFGVLTGHGIEATTYFAADSSATGPSTSPGWVSYSGEFTYTTDDGTLLMRETGVSHPRQGDPDSGGVSAFQHVLSGTGRYEGATGHLIVGGFNIAGHVETDVVGEICRP
jgi:hypothetical protein